MRLLAISIWLVGVFCFKIEMKGYKLTSFLTPLKRMLRVLFPKGTNYEKN